MCNGKADGNYEVRYPNGEYDPNYFLQCSGGRANCQPCWPQTLEFSQTCNQCLYSRDGENKYYICLKIVTKVCGMKLPVAE